MEKALQEQQLRQELHLESALHAHHEGRAESPSSLLIHQDSSGATMAMSQLSSNYIPQVNYS